jgi:tetratricopeptide (TPR) repeat protein
MDAKLTAPAASTRLILEQSGLSAGRRRFLVDPGRTVKIGHAAQADVVVSDHATMSSLHFSISWNGADAFLHDLDSATGTLLNDSRIRSTQVRHGDWIRAGSTDFHVYEEGFSQREPATTTPEREEALRVLRERRDELYCIVDASRSLRIVGLLRESADEWRFLYEGLERPRSRYEPENVAPYLVRLSDPASPLLDALVREGWGRKWGIYLVSTRPFDDLYEHFRCFLTIDDPVGEPMTFRFYDPTILRQELSLLPPRGCQRAWFDGVSCFIIEWEGGREARILGPKGTEGVVEESVILSDLRTPIRRALGSQSKNGANPGEAALNKTDVQDRIRSLLEELELAPNDAGKWFELGSLRNRYAPRRHVAASFQKAYDLEASPKHAEALASALDQEGDRERAFQLMTERVLAGGASIATLLQYGFWATTLPKDSTRFGHAERALREALARTSAASPRDRERRSVAWGNLGNLYKNHGKLAEAIEAYDQGIAENPGAAYLATNKASAMKKLNPR